MFDTVQCTPVNILCYNIPSADAQCIRHTLSISVVVHFVISSIRVVDSAPRPFYFLCLPSLSHGAIAMHNYYNNVECSQTVYTGMLLCLQGGQPMRP